MVHDPANKSAVNFVTMNRSYLSYFKDKNPFRLISNMFRNYKKSSENVKRNQSEPTVTQKQPNKDLDSTKPKSESNLCKCQNDKRIEQWNNSKFDDDSSQDGLIMSPSNSKVDRASSNISLRKTSCHLDLNIQEKLNHIPLQSIKVEDSTSTTKIPLKRAYPWQNFNLENVRKPRYEQIKEVSDMREEIISHLKFRKSILRKPELKSLNDRQIPMKEVKFNKLASMITYPKTNPSVMRQARINLSTNAIGVERIATPLHRKKKIPVLNVNKAGIKMPCPHNYRKSIKKLRKCLPMEHGHFWYLCNAKKQKIF